MARASTTPLTDAQTTDVIRTKVTEIAQRVNDIDAEGTIGGGNATAIAGITVDVAGVVAGAVLKYDGTNWIDGVDQTSSGSSIPGETTVATPVGVAATDTAAINTAITAAGANGMVRFRPGTYITTGGHAMLSGQTWIVPPGCTLQLASTSTTAMIGTASGGRITGGGTLDGNKTGIASGSANTSTHVIFVNAGNAYVTIENLTIQNCFRSAIISAASGSNASHVIVRSNRITNCGAHAIQWRSRVWYGKILDNHIDTTDANANGIWIGKQSGDTVSNACQHAIIRGNVITGSKDMGIEVWGGCHHTIVANNTVHHTGVANDMGISIDDSQNCVVNGNLVLFDSGTIAHNGIELVRSDGISCVGNTVIGAFRAIICDGLDGGAITGNTLINMVQRSTQPAWTGAGIYIAMGGSSSIGGKHLTISGNQIGDTAVTGMRGIHADANSSHLTISGNNFYNIAHNDIQLDQTTYVTISGNNFDSTSVASAASFKWLTMTEPNDGLGNKVTVTGNTVIGSKGNPTYDANDVQANNNVRAS